MDLPRFYRKTNNPEAGVYELVMLTGFTDSTGKHHGPLYVCKSLSGLLSESLAWGDMPHKWDIDYDYEPGGVTSGEAVETIAKALRLVPKESRLRFVKKAMDFLEHEYDEDDEEDGS